MNILEDEDNGKIFFIYTKDLINYFVKHFYFFYYCVRDVKVDLC